MELDITFILNDDLDLWPCCGSVATHGQDVARLTWEESKQVNTELNLINTENRLEVENYFAEFGAWEREEIAGWDDLELGALLLQDICCNLIDCGIDLDSGVGELSIDGLSEILSSSEHSNIFCHNGHVYYYIGH